MEKFSSHNCSCDEEFAIYSSLDEFLTQWVLVSSLFPPPTLNKADTSALLAALSNHVSQALTSWASDFFMPHLLPSLLPSFSHLKLPLMLSKPTTHIRQADPF